MVTAYWEKYIRRNKDMHTWLLHTGRSTLGEIRICTQLLYTGRSTLGEIRICTHGYCILGEVHKEK